MVLGAQGVLLVLCTEVTGTDPGWLGSKSGWVEYIYLWVPSLGRLAWKDFKFEINLNYIS